MAKVKKLRVVSSYDARGALGHIDLTCGEYVVEIQPDKKGWTVVRTVAGEEGGVPTKHLG